MKKIIAVLLILCMIFAFAGCSASKEDKGSSTPVSQNANVDLDELDEEEEEEKKEFPTLSGDEEYVVVRRKGKTFEVKDITEIKNYKVGYVRNSDSELIALYYCEQGDEHLAGHGTDQDAFADLMGDRVDIVICRKMSAEVKDNVEIILDPIEMIELK